MSAKEAFDQSDIDKLVAEAESDTIESKVANLEAEVTEIKGSIKALIMDIRETMSVLENPFQNIQGLANISSAIVTPKLHNENGIEDESLKEKREEKESEQDNSNMELFEALPSFFKSLLFLK